MDRALDVGRHILGGALDGGHDIADAGEMKNVTSPFEQSVIGRAAADVPELEDEIGITGMVSEIFLPSAGEIVHHAHYVTLVEQQIHHMAADEAGATRYHCNRPDGHSALISLRRRTL